MSVRSNPSEYIVVGAGIAGMAAAFRLQQQLPPECRIRILESSDRWGGVLQTEHSGDTILEHSADMFSIDPPAAIDLCREIGLEDSLLSAQPAPDRAYVATESGMEPIPRGFSLMLPGNLDAVIGSNILSPDGKQRLLQEESIPPKQDTQDESLSSFAIRRFGTEVFQRLIQPLASGIYTADPDRLSMRATMDRFCKLEQKFGSLIAAGKAQSSNQATSGARYNLFRAPKEGMGQLADALHNYLTSSRPNEASVSFELQTRVDSVRQVETADSRIAVEAAGPSGDKTRFECDGLVLATPSFVTASILKDESSETYRELCRELESIEFASSAVVIFEVERQDIQPADFDAYGIVIPSFLNQRAIAISIASNKFNFRCDSSSQIIRVFIGGALQGELVDLDDPQLIELAFEECQRHLKLTQNPKRSRVRRWRRCMPQYHVGHLERQANIDRYVTRLPGIELAGKSYRGVGIPACIESGIRAANSLLQTSNHDD